MRHLFYNSVWLPAAVTTVMLLIALGILVSTSWHSMHRLEPMHDHLALMNKLQQAGVLLQEVLADSIASGTPINKVKLDAARNEFIEVSALDQHLDPETQKRLLQIDQLLGEDATSLIALVAAQQVMRQILSVETMAHDELLTRVKEDTRFEFDIAIGIMVAFPALTLLMIFFLKDRIVAPLDNLRSLMLLLAQQDYTSASTEGVNPMLRPLFDNYNHLVERLTALEQGHRARHQSLEKEVRAATRTLLAQQRDLANAERLAAVGEISAGLAHELRNPLAGIQMALINLRSEVADPEKVERLNLIIGEHNRLHRLLNDILAQARQAPEAERDLDLRNVVDELLSLARYQVPAHIHLEHDIASALKCRLPEGGLRQALLNLVLNSSQVLQNRTGNITISAKHIGDRLLLRVEDDGPGFPAEVLDAGIRPFATRREHGTGLGLAMVRRFVRDQNGELQLANQQPHGARVVLSLPFKEVKNG